LNGEQTNILRTISVLILRVVTWLPGDPFRRLACNIEHGAQTGIETTEWIPGHVTTLRMRTETVLETLSFFTFRPLDPSDNPKELYPNHSPGKCQIVVKTVVTSLVIWFGRKLF